MSDLTPITREEALLDGADLEPITRKEQFIKRIYDKTQEVPEPITREEWFLNKAGEGGGEVTVEQLNATENGTYSEPGKAYSPVIVEVPEPTLITKSITANGTYSASADNADGYSSVTVAVDGFKRKSIANTPTDIASFDDGTANPMPSLKISIEPVQSGSGDPSPSNVRPISGWSGANVTKCGVNLFNPQEFLEDYPSNFKIAVDGSVETVGSIASGMILWKNINSYDGNIAVTYTYKYESTGSVGMRIVIKYKDGTTRPMYTIQTQEYITLTQISEKPIDFIYTDYGSRTNKTNFYLQIELGSTTTAYSPYQGSTLSIPFHDNSDNPITVYGGTLDVTSGELKATHANIASYNGETINEPWISSMDAYSAGTTPTTGAQVVYPLATPQIYQLTPAQVSTLLGQNNIFADCGQVLEGEYFVTL